jgi:ISXO2-like transposase domain
MAAVRASVMEIIVHLVMCHRNTVHRNTVYDKIGEAFANHHAVNHSANEYVRMGAYVHSNSAENFFSIFKRGITGVYHSVSEAHLNRYLTEFDFRYSNRSLLGVEDQERASRALADVARKRLTYRT